MFKDLIKQTVINASLKIRFDYKDGSFEELLGTIEEEYSANFYLTETFYPGKWKFDVRCDIIYVDKKNEKVNNKE